MQQCIYWKREYRWQRQDTARRLYCIKLLGDYSKEGFNLLIIGNPATIVNKGFSITNE